MTLLAAFRSIFLAEPKPSPFQQAMADFDRREADAIRRGCTRDVGRVRRQRHAFTNADLQR